jgi:peptidoglycan hydrolase-like amidase
MFHLPNKHQIFNRSVLWPVSLFSAALFVPFVVAKSLPPEPQTVTSSSKPSPNLQASPNLQPSPQPSEAHLSAEREWHRGIMSQSFSWQPTPTTATNTTPSKSPGPKTDTPQSQASVPKTATPSSPKPKTKTQASRTPSTGNQQQAKAQSSTREKAKAAPSPSNAAPVVEMRVAIANGVGSLVVGTSTAGEVLDANGKLLGKLPANEGTSIEPDGSLIRVGKWQTPAGVWLKPAKGGLVFVGDRWYRGDLLLVSQGSTLLAVNYVDLESYISSVVGAEVSPSWPMAALKAQAIAARSYALVHYIRPANPLYDLGNTQRWQVYRGISAEWNTTRQAVQETKGAFLSYKGGVVESMYAASDDIVKNVFGGRGMSQNGALSLAQQGYTYQEILGKYYPGTGLAWIDTKQHDHD